MITAEGVPGIVSYETLSEKAKNEYDGLRKARDNAKATLNYAINGLEGKGHQVPGLERPEQRGTQTSRWVNLL
jgi:hypothetical protein